jgi:hypothetical protein
MAIVVHIVNTPKTDATEAYEASWALLDAQNARHPEGRQSHTAWLVGDVLHVCDVWDAQENMDAFMKTIGPVMQECGMTLAGPPEVGQLLKVVRPD